MSSIFIDDKEYGLKRLNRKLKRLYKRLEQLESKELSNCGYEELGRIKEAIYIYEDLVDKWNLLINQGDKKAL